MSSSKTSNIFPMSYCTTPPNVAVGLLTNACPTWTLSSSSSGIPPPIPNPKRGEVVKELYCNSCSSIVACFGYHRHHQVVHSYLAQSAAICIVTRWENWRERVGQMRAEFRVRGNHEPSGPFLAVLLLGWCPAVHIIRGAGKDTDNLIIERCGSEKRAPHSLQKLRIKIVPMSVVTS